MTTSVCTRSLDPASPATHVAIAGEPELVVQGLRSVLRRNSSRLTLVDPSPHADLLLYDSTLLDGQQFVELVARSGAQGVRFAEFGWRTDPDSVRRALARGAAGYVFKGLEASLLTRTLERVADGRWTEPLVEDPDACAPGSPAAERERVGLSGREVEMLVHIARGLSNQEIAASSFLSINSVKTYIRTGYRKIGVSRRSQAVRWAIKHDLVDVRDVVAANAS
jgi:two-component system, NarL family, response regulator LiaR